MENTLLDTLCSWLGQNRSFFKMSGEESDFLGEIDGLYTYFLKNLNREDAEKFKKLCTSFDGLVSEEAGAYFKMGFKFALKLAVECFVQ